MDLSSLNNAQRDAVLHDGGPLLVLAGAGTGKTTVITQRIGWDLAKRGVRPDEVLALTFTNKAAREMRERATRLAHLPPTGLDIGTFHGICGKFLRLFAPKLGLTSSFVIYDESDQLQLIKAALKDLNIDPESFSPKMMRHAIEAWKNKGKTPKRVEPGQFDKISKNAARVYEVYEKRLRDVNAVDFGNLLLHTVTLLREDEEVRQYAHNRWRNILVDEYQDTNPVQYELLQLLHREGDPLTVVGDDDQSIYRWRGADIQNILRFERDYDDATVIRLEENYRSTQSILNVANQVISNNTARKGKTLFTRGEEGPPIRFRVFTTEREEGEALAQGIKEAIRDGYDAEEIAILYRINAQSRALEDSLRRRSIPYRIYGGVRFYDRKEIKNAIAYLRLVLNPRSDVDLMRVINTPARGIGKTSLERMTDIARADNITLLDAARKAHAGEVRMTGKAKKALSELITWLDELHLQVEEEHPARLLEDILRRSGYLAALHLEGTEEAETRVENLDELVNALDEYADTQENPSLSGFLEQASLISDIDGLNDENEQVSLMTMHAAKGLEFTLVFMPGMEEGLFPHSRSLDEHAALEEERRLCYVGITRAKYSLMMSAARMRTTFGQVNYPQLSRFLTEIPEKYLELGAEPSSRPQRASYQREFEDYSDLDDFEDNYSDSNSDDSYDDESESDPFSDGKHILHKTFGIGQVLSSSGSGRDRKLRIKFPEAGLKTIVSRFVSPV